MAPSSPYYYQNRLEPSQLLDYEYVLRNVRRRSELSLPHGVASGIGAINDHPELFWACDMLCIEDDGARACYWGLSDKLIGTMQREIDEASDRFIEAAPLDGSDWNKALFVYEMLVRDVHYTSVGESRTLGALHPSSPGFAAACEHTIYGPLVLGTGVCEGYARTAQYLLQLLDVECACVTNSARMHEEGHGHTWNLVRIDGAYSYFDCTLGRAQSDYDGTARYVSHMPFGLSQDEQDLIPYHEMNPSIYRPEQTTVEHNWFRRTGRFVEEFDAGRVDTLLAADREAGSPALELRCASDGLRNQVEGHLSATHGLTCERRRLSSLVAWL